MAKERGKVTSISWSQKMLKKVDKRVLEGESRSARVERDLQTFYDLCQAGLKAATLRFSRSEAMVILDAHWSTMISNYPLLLSPLLALDSEEGLGVHRNTLQGDVADAIKLEGLDTKYGIDGEYLVAKLGACPQLMLLGLYEWIEQARAVEDITKVVSVFKADTEGE